MSSYELSRSEPDRLPRREARDLSRSRARLDGRARLELERIEQEADLQAARVRAVGFVSGVAAMEAAKLIRLVDGIGRMIPAASEDLHDLTRLLLVGMAEIAHDTSRRVR